MVASSCHLECQLKILLGMSVYSVQQGQQGQQEGTRVNFLEKASSLKHLAMSS